MLPPNVPLDHSRLARLPSPAHRDLVAPWGAVGHGCAGSNGFSHCSTRWIPGGGSGVGGVHKVTTAHTETYRFESIPIDALWVWRVALEPEKPLLYLQIPHTARALGWWALTGSNRRPLPCKSISAHFGDQRNPLQTLDSSCPVGIGLYCLRKNVVLVVGGCGHVVCQFCATCVSR